MSEPWYRSAIIYGVDVEKYADGNGDGVGDFPGLTGRLDYIEELGVTCIWLLPFHPSPRRDNGYDVTDYFGVDPRFGTLHDFSDFVKRAGERGIRVIMDLVLDHTSDEHPWFQAARRSRSSRYRGYYVWSDMPPPAEPCAGPVFPGEEDSIWTHDDLAGAYYYHRFYSFQPTLDLHNAEVRREVEQILDFWLCFGVSGFRLDAVPIMLGLDQPTMRKPQNPHGVLRDLRALMEQRRPGAALLGEADVEAEQVVKYFGDDDELDMLFNFLLNNWLWLSLARHSKQPLLRVLDQLPAPTARGQWVNFARNLDELNLGWLTAEDRDHVLAELSPDPGTHVYGRGVRRRLAPLLGRDPRRIALALSLVVTLPGTPMLVYGDELGMGDDLTLPGRDAARGRMPWTAADSRDGGPSVEASLADPDSLLARVRTLLRARGRAPEFGLGHWHVLPADGDAVLAHRCNWRDGIVIAVHNLCGTPQQVALDLRDQQGRRLEGLLRAEECTIGPEPFRFELEAYGYRWYRVAGERLAGKRPCVHQ